MYINNMAIRDGIPRPAKHAILNITTGLSQLNVHYYPRYYEIPAADIMPPHVKACVSRNCDTNARIKFIFDTAIDDLEILEQIVKNQNGRRWPFCENMMKKLVHSIT